MKLLITGFEPFDGAQVNPSQDIARALDGTALGTIEVVSATLPVHHTHGPTTLLHALEQYQPDAVICLGQASGRPALSIERVAVNWLDYRIPDNSGEQITDQEIVPGGPAAYFATLPTRAIWQALRAEGIPAELSMSAGTYLCNQVMYLLLHNLAQARRVIPAGFLHLPALPQQAAAASHPLPSMPFETALAGVRIAAETVAAHLLVDT